MALLDNVGVEGEIFPILIDLATMARPHILNAIILHGKPMVTGSHNLVGQ